MYILVYLSANIYTYTHTYTYTYTYKNIKIYMCVSYHPKEICEGFFVSLGSEFRNMANSFPIPPAKIETNNNNNNNNILYYIC